MEDNKKGHQTIATSSEENGCHRNSSEPEKSEQNQLSELQSNTVIVDAKGVENTVVERSPGNPP